MKIYRAGWTSHLNNQRTELKPELENKKQQNEMVEDKISRPFHSNVNFKLHTERVPLTTPLK